MAAWIECRSRRLRAPATNTYLLLGTDQYPSGVGAVSGVFGLPVPRHKIVDAIDFVLRQALEDPCEPCLGVDVVQLAGFHERIGDCSRFSAAD